jgi:selenocysteine lyase/cysteine desulfurase
MTLTEFRRHFPIVTTHTYLNSASVGPLPDTGVEAISAAAREQAGRGSGFLSCYDEAQARVRAKVAALLGVDAEEIAFVRNTVEGLSIVASGFPWRAGDNVVASALEFSGNAYPWLNAERHGVGCRFVPSPDGSVDVDRLIATTDARTRLITVSLVQFSTGYRVDLPRLGTLCAERGITLVVDGIQGIGVVPVDLRASQVGFLSCGTHKWLCNTIGFGFLYVRRDLLEDLALTEIGHGSVRPVPDTYTAYRLALRPDARRFEAGVMSYAHLVGLEASLDLIAQVGLRRLHAHITTLSRRLADGLRARGYAVCSPQHPEHAAGITAFTGPRAAAEIETTLAAQGIVVSVREGAVRVSVHGFNTSEEVDRLLEALS